MKKTILTKMFLQWLAVFTLLVSGALWAANGVDLTQSPEVSGTPEGSIHMPKQQGRMALNYVNQPPMIPHSVDGYQVSKNTNRCLQCHGVEHYRTTGAPRVSPTHFMDSDGNVLSNVAPRRYFCLQCHVPQTDAAPIVENTFTPSKGFGN
ncbi:nitrate reductase cytochrome c-type subunit [Buttiauxella noackiae]|uniref:Periplasmic nitrate reductase, electron transfer subunit n=1 Tax=Buttiauxella noackiae ATCC 51607 TaxID=1354255 RepID=A0A1B7HNK3_9ENTR|nr:nitrate reductase cytochrome c-type subunit [Buttiauxella noackiae]MCA1922549.1 nitrate reductase cytochrome c-type subunit [Buttiauxella noackiae]OAT17214.1 nitrate reductase cytochrome c550-type subunit [Buttiauxella noackiae ATCC 51607]